MNNTTGSLPRDMRGVHIHFVGIKGTGMVALVEILFARGAVITGSDVSERFYTDDVLDKLGLKALPFGEKNITNQIQYVIYSSAYNPQKNPDLIEASRRGIPMMLYSEALGAVSATAYSAGVCGVHGKTTTTGLVGTILEELNFPAQVLAGSVISSFGDSCTMTSPACRTKGHTYFVAETCEYQRHFMAFCPQKIILTAVESDHEDYYPTYNDIRDAFVDYICKLPQHGQLIYCADEKGAVETAGIAKSKRPDIELVPYGEKADGPYKLTFGKVENDKHYFTVQSIGECVLNVPGDHLVRNANAAIALCCELVKTDEKTNAKTAGISPGQIEKIKSALLKFTGGKRRSEVLGERMTPLGQSVLFIDDYGHHPTAIKTTLAGYREFYKGRKIIIDFMSHTYTRTAALLEDFAQSFDCADEVILNKIYASAREDPSAANVTGEILAEHAKKYHKHVTYCDEFDEAAAKGLELLSAPSTAPIDGKNSPYDKGYLFVTMGAGDNWKVGKKIMEKLNK
jgi:UDP-N-acetylmuramate--alanine ligase